MRDQGKEAPSAMAAMFPDGMKRMMAALTALAP